MFHFLRNSEYDLSLIYFLVYLRGANFFCDPIWYKFAFIFMNFIFQAAKLNVDSLL